MNILKIVLQAGLVMWDTYKVRKAKQKAFVESPRSSLLVQCNTCGNNVRADALSMSEHKRTCTT